MRFDATYDATKKSLEFPSNPATSSNSGNRDSIETGPTLDGTQLVKGYSVSTWFRADSQASWEQVWVLGKNGLGKHEGLWLSGSAVISIHTDAGGGMNYYYPCTSGGNWKHVTFVRKGTTSSNHDVYVDGVKVTASSTANGTAVQAFEKDSNLVLGENINHTDYGFDGAISNFKLYDTVLTASEVKTLYDMGRLGNGLYPLHIDAPVYINGPLYAPGTILNISQSFYDGGMVTSSGSLQDVFSTEWVSMRKNSKVEVDLSVLYRNDGTAWGGIYVVAWFMVDVPVGSVAANTWVAYLTPGYHMTYYQEIPEYGNTSYLPFNIPTDFKIRFLLQVKPYNSGTTLYINRSHSLLLKMVYLLI
tara:strand:- start:28 stop:1107 length:1080 start_codon:yes stop_codon:yes gene_type:complete